jgi:hypothetical protein
MKDRVIETHLSVRSRAYEAKVDGKTLILYHCPQCGRDFAREENEVEWRAAHIGAFKVDFLQDEQWAAEPCPGQSITEPCPGQTVEVAPTILPPQEIAKAPRNRGGRPSKVRSLPAIKP